MTRKQRYFHINQYLSSLVFLIKESEASQTNRLEIDNLAYSLVSLEELEGHITKLADELYEDEIYE